MQTAPPDCKTHTRSVHSSSSFDGILPEEKEEAAEAREEGVNGHVGGLRHEWLHNGATKHHDIPRTPKVTVDADDIVDVNNT